MKAKILKLKFLLACLRFVKDPRRTEEVFALSAQLASPEKFRATLALLKQNPETKNLIESNYRPGRIDRNIETYAPGTLGRAYLQYMRDNNLDPDFYEVLPTDSEINFVRTRIRETHDIWHVITEFKTDNAGEAGLGAVYVSQMQSSVLALTTGLLLVHAVLFDSSNIPNYFEQIARGWKIGKASYPLFARRWEEELHRPLAEIRKELGISHFFTSEDRTLHARLHQ